jgi:hypothetical protein
MFMDCFIIEIEIISQLRILYLLTFSKKIIDVVHLSLRWGCPWRSDSLTDQLIHTARKWREKTNRSMLTRILCKVWMLVWYRELAEACLHLSTFWVLCKSVMVGSDLGLAHVHQQSHYTHTHTHKEDKTEWSGYNMERSCSKSDQCR